MAVLVLLIAAAFAAQTGSADSIPYFSEGITGFTVVGILVLFWKIQRSLIRPLTERVAAQEAALKRERKARALAEWRNRELVLELARNGEAVPDQIVYGFPDWYEEADEK